MVPLQGSQIRSDVETIFQDHPFLAVVHERLRTSAWTIIQRVCCGYNESEAKRLSIRAGNLGPWEAVNVSAEHVFSAELACVIKGLDLNATTDTLLGVKRGNDQLVTVYKAALVWITANCFNNSQNVLESDSKSQKSHLRQCHGI